MNCQKCNVELPKNETSCPKCNSNNKDLAIESERITKEEYLLRTNIKSIEDASKYHTRLKMLFTGTIIVSTLTRVFANFIEMSNVYALIYLLFFITNISLIIYFIAYSIKVLKAEKISRWNAALCVFFAPISWIWFYPTIMDPLKIIMGKKNPPLKNPEIKAKKKGLSLAWWILIIFVSVIVLPMIILMTL